MAKEERTSQPHTGRKSRSRSRSPSLSRSRRSRSRSCDSEEAANPGNNLYVTGLSTRVTETDLEKFFNREGKVLECHLVRDPHSKESRGFAFVTMETNKDADKCVEKLNRSVLEGRLITVEKAKRKRGRTPTPGQYQGLRDKRGSDRSRRRSRSYSPRRRNDRDSDRGERRGLLSDRGERRGRRPSPYGRRSGDDNTHRRRRERS
ncbi:RNA-binding family protein [Perilla frutescens var. hirtella]|uniref:RNA-binding family protein n=1 Tax=Perilla frutescens var. hirtella TaxID=608512 RepID=A0AAD4JND3_PERFH|nr:RNA-binding family protein [Perilla frutescens var. frutescens]KAH6787427.1 RNA-binding family protein [Perilla frutescens var. hirtella]KAH6836178.1 RNA-binding family protein [Perilla frutescens var. hirtella]